VLAGSLSPSGKAADLHVEQVQATVFGARKLDRPAKIVERIKLKKTGRNRYRATYKATLKGGGKPEVIERELDIKIDNAAVGGPDGFDLWRNELFAKSGTFLKRAVVEPLREHATSGKSDPKTVDSDTGFGNYRVEVNPAVDLDSLVV
jgi:hypothetical protein